MTVHSVPIYLLPISIAKGTNTNVARVKERKKERKKKGRRKEAQKEDKVIYII
jgi:hypothetical protein